MTATEASELPILLAILERTAAEYYRHWSQEASDPLERAGLIACAETEVQIAEAIESLTTDLERRTLDLKARFPELAATYAAVMKGLPRADQLRIQAEGENGGRCCFVNLPSPRRLPKALSLNLLPYGKKPTRRFFGQSRVVVLSRRSGSFANPEIGN